MFPIDSDKFRQVSSGWQTVFYELRRSMTTERQLGHWLRKNCCWQAGPSGQLGDNRHQHSQEKVDETVRQTWDQEREECFIQTTMLPADRRPDRE